MPSSTSFGQRLRRLREATQVSGSGRFGGRWPRAGPLLGLSQNALARLARLDPSHVSLLEDGRRQASRATAERLATALAASHVERAMLLVSAGFWPWTDADDETTGLLVALALAVLDGDYRPLEATVRDCANAGGLG